MDDMINKTKKSFRFSVDIVKKEGDIDKDFYVEGYASTYDLDRQGEIITREALEKSAKELVEINNTVFYGHLYDLNNAVGKIVEAQADENGLRVKIFVSSWAKELRVKINEGIISKFSIGGAVRNDRKVPKTQAKEEGLIKDDVPFDYITVIDDLELYEVSFVGVPANPNAQVVGTFTKALHEIYKSQEGGESMKEKEKELKKEEALEEKNVIETKTEETEEKKEEVKEETKEEQTEEKKETETSTEVSEDEIKDLLEKETEEPEETEEKAKKPYYYYYGKGIKEMLDKLGKEIADIAKDVKEIKETLKEKVKTVEVVDEKKTVIKEAKEDKKEDKQPEVQLDEEEVLDQLFGKVITKSLKRS